MNSKQRKSSHDKLAEVTFYEKSYQIIWNQYRFFEEKHSLSKVLDTIITITGLTITLIIGINDHLKDTEGVWILSVIILFICLILALWMRLPRLTEIPYIKQKDYRIYEEKKILFFKEAIDDIFENIPKIEAVSLAQRKKIKQLLRMYVLALLILILLPLYHAVTVISSSLYIFFLKIIC